MPICEDDRQIRAEITKTGAKNHEKDEKDALLEFEEAETAIPAKSPNPNPDHEEDAILEFEEAEASLSKTAPWKLMHRGTYEMARTAAMSKDKWLLINLQSSTNAEASLALNKETWRNTSVVDTIRSKFVFWQDEDTSEDGVCFGSRFTESLPVIMLIEPYTSSIRWTHVGFVQPAELLENLGGIERDPSDFCRNYDLDIASALGLGEMSLY